MRSAWSATSHGLRSGCAAGPAASLATAIPAGNVISCGRLGSLGYVMVAHDSLFEAPLDQPLLDLRRLWSSDPAGGDIADWSSAERVASAVFNPDPAVVSCRFPSWPGSTGARTAPQHSRSLRLVRMAAMRCSRLMVVRKHLHPRGWGARDRSSRSAFCGSPERLRTAASSFHAGIGTRRPVAPGSTGAAPAVSVCLLRRVSLRRSSRHADPKWDVEKTEDGLPFRFQSPSHENIFSPVTQPPASARAVSTGMEAADFGAAASFERP